MFANHLNPQVWDNTFPASRLRHQHTTRLWRDDQTLAAPRYIPDTHHKSPQMSSFQVPTTCPYPVRSNQSNNFDPRTISFDSLDANNVKFKLGTFSSFLERRGKLIMTRNVHHPKNGHAEDILQSKPPKSFNIRDILKQDHGNSSNLEERHNQKSIFSSKSTIGQIKTHNRTEREKLTTAHSANNTDKYHSGKSKYQKSKSAETNLQNSSAPHETMSKDAPSRSAFTLPIFSGTKENFHYNELSPNHSLGMNYNIFISGCQRSNQIQDSWTDNNSNATTNSKSTSTKHIRVSYSSTYCTQSIASPIFGNYDNASPICNSSNSYSQPPITASLPSVTTSTPSERSRTIYHNSQDRKKFQCPQCRYLTDRKNNLMRHIITMHQDSGKVLECCGIAFQSKSSLREHNSVFHSGGYRCQICSRNFCRKALLRRHLTVHSGQKDFYCDLCGYATSHKSNLERHQKVHNKRYRDRLDTSTINDNNNNGRNKNKNHRRNDIGPDTKKVPGEAIHANVFTGILGFDGNTTTMEVSSDCHEDSENLDGQDDRNTMDISVSSDDESEFVIIDVELPFEQTFQSELEISENENSKMSNNSSISADFKECLSTNISDVKNGHSLLVSHPHRKSNEIFPKTPSKRRGFFTSRIISTHCLETSDEECDHNCINGNQATKDFEAIGTSDNSKHFHFDDDCIENTIEDMEGEEDGLRRSSNNNIKIDYLTSTALCEQEEEAINNVSVLRVVDDCNDELSSYSDEIGCSKIDDDNARDSKCENISFEQHDKADNIMGRVVDNDCDRNSHNGECYSSTDKIVRIYCKGDEIKRETIPLKIDNDELCEDDAYSKNTDCFSLGKEGSIDKCCNDSKRDILMIPDEMGQDATREAKKEISSDIDLEITYKTMEEIRCSDSENETQCQTDKETENTDRNKHLKSDTTAVYKGRAWSNLQQPRKSRLCPRLYSCHLCHEKFQNQIDYDAHVCGRHPEEGDNSVCLDIPISVIALRKKRKMS